MQVPSPWPDVIISSHHDLAPVHHSTDNQPPRDFHVDLPHSSCQHGTHDPFSHTSSAYVTAGSTKLAMRGTADMYGEQQQMPQAGKAAAQE